MGVQLRTAIQNDLSGRWIIGEVHKDAGGTVAGMDTVLRVGQLLEPKAERSGVGFGVLALCGCVDEGVDGCGLQRAGFNGAFVSLLGCVGVLQWPFMYCSGLVPEARSLVAIACRLGQCGVGLGRVVPSAGSGERVGRGDSSEGVVGVSCGGLRIERGGSCGVLDDVLRDLSHSEERLGSSIALLLCAALTQDRHGIVGPTGFEKKSDCEVGSGIA